MVFQLQNMCFDLRYLLLLFICQDLHLFSCTCIFHFILNIMHNQLLNGNLNSHFLDSHILLAESSHRFLHLNLGFASLDTEMAPSACDTILTHPPLGFLGALYLFINFQFLSYHQNLVIVKIYHELDPLRKVIVNHILYFSLI